jgi:mannosyltransferase OCH1-like enzyme
MQHKLKLTGSNQIPAELNQAEEIYKLIHFIWNKEELPKQWSVTVPIYKKGDKTDCSN